MLSIKKLLMIAIVCPIFTPVLVFAGPIDPALSVQGSVSWDESDATLLDPANTYSGDVYSVVGGTNTNGDVLFETLTDIGDGLGHVASLSGTYDGSATDLAGDYQLDLSNSSTDTFKLTFCIEYDHSADGEGGPGNNFDARARSRMGFEVAPDPEFFKSEVTSESGKDYYDAGNPTWQDLFRDINGETYLGTWGAEVADADTVFFDVVLAGNASATIYGDFHLDGRIWDTGASYAMDSSIFIKLAAVENLTNPVVPEPTTLALGTLALLGIAYRRYR